MDKETVIKIVNEFHQKIVAKGINPSKLILYGSHVTGRIHEDSDIDLVVISDDFKEKDFWERIEIMADVICELFVPIEAVAMTQEEWEKGDSFITDYARNGEVLYAA